MTDALEAEFEPILEGTVDNGTPCDINFPGLIEGEAVVMVKGRHYEVGVFGDYTMQPFPFSGHINALACTAIRARRGIDERMSVLIIRPN